VVNEFPTAPKDSFFVTNADYLAASTGSDAVGAFLVDTDGQDTAGTAERIRGLQLVAQSVTPDGQSVPLGGRPVTLPVSDDVRTLAASAAGGQTLSTEQIARQRGVRPESSATARSPNRRLHPSRPGSRTGSWWAGAVRVAARSRTAVRRTVA
jgi:hypothetical protein